jgi:hypothetical protein
MDDQLLRELIAGQKEQTELLRRYLWRFRFSLMTILLLMTCVCVGLGFLVYRQNSAVGGPTRTATIQLLPTPRILPSPISSNTFVPVQPTYQPVPTTNTPSAAPPPATQDNPSAN